MILGGNILDLALSIIGTDSFEYVAFESQETGPSGFKRQKFAPAVPLEGSVQPMGSKDVFDRGLVLTESYITVRADLSFLEGGRDVSSDKVVFSGDNYQVISVTPWNEQNGWGMAVCQKLRENHAK